MTLLSARTFYHRGKGLWYLLLLAALMLGLGLGLRFPNNVDEQRFLGIALEMLQNGDWLVPHRAAEIYGDKPPLFFWLLAALIKLTGSPKVAMVLPAFLSGLIGTALIHDLSRRLYNRRIAFYAGLLFLLSYQTHAILRDGQIDGFLFLWTVVGFYGFARHLLDTCSWRWYFMACAACGFGIICKGVGFLPALMFLPFLYARKQQASHIVRHKASAGMWLLGPLMTLLAISVWLAPLLWRALQVHDEATNAYLHNILLHQTAGRLVNAWHHKEPFWYFPVIVMPKYWLPAIVILPWLIPLWRQQWQKRDGRVMILLSWVVLVLVFFSLSTGKRKPYIYPAIPAFVMIVAAVWPYLMRQWRQRFFIRCIQPILIFWFTVVMMLNVYDVYSFRRSDEQKMMQIVSTRVAPQATLGMAGWRENIWLYARNPLHHFGFDQQHEGESVLFWLSQDVTRKAIVSADVLRQCFNADTAEQLADNKHGGWFLVMNKDANGQCVAQAAQHEYDFHWQKQWF